MKHMQKLTCLLLALIMVLSLGITAFAATGDATTQRGSITINNALEGNNLTLYKIFDLESYDTTANSYQYTIQGGENPNPLYTTIEAMTVTVQSGNTQTTEKVFSLSPKAGTTDIYYVELTPNLKNAPNDGPTVKSIASQLEAKINSLTEAQKATLRKAQVTKLGLTDQTKTDNTTVEEVTGEGNEQLSNVKFSDLDLGYYLVDSTAGAMIGLTSTAPDATMIAKNKHPKVDKEVKRNVDGVWDGANAKPIGEPVEFRVQVSVEEGAKNYVIHDIMSEGLTFTGITKIYYGNPVNPLDEHVVYDITVDSKKSMDGICVFEQNAKYTPKGKTEQTCTFKMTFKEDFIKQILEDTHKDDTGYNKVIYVEYAAKLNEKAVIGDVNNNGGNSNEVYLTYGENNIEVSHDKTTSYTYKIELVKHKDDKTLLDGAEFEMYHTNADALAGNNKIHFVKITPANPGEKTIYRVATQEEINTANKTTTTIEAGDVIIHGLGGSFATGVSEDGRSYFLKETKAPNGYTKLPNPVPFNVKKNDEMATIADGKWVSGGLHVENKTGNVMPSTGGIGTTIFYVVGSVLLVGAGVLLVTKKRMSVQ